VIVLKQVGGVDQATGLVRHSAGGSTTTVDEAGQSRVKSASCGSTASIEHGKTVESTTLDADLMSTSRGSDDDWAALGLGACATATSADPWSAIVQRHDTTKAATTLTTTTALVDQKGQTEVDCGAASSGWWPAEASGTTPTRMADVFSSLNVFRHHQTALQGATGVQDDTERLIDDANDRPIL